MTPVSRPRSKFRFVPLATVLFVLALPSAASAELTGPVYPLPGGPTSGHGGNVCAATGLDGGVPGGVTWTFGGGTPTSPSSCPVSVTTPAAFNQTRFLRLFWGSRSGARPTFTMNGAVDTPVETLTFQETAPTNRAQGILVWTGATLLFGCKAPSCSTFTNFSIQTQLKLTFLSGTAGTTPVALDTPAAAGIADPQVGGVVPIKRPGASLTNFRVKIEFLASDNGGATFQSAQSLFNSYNNSGADRLRTSFTGAFWYENTPPAADFTFSHQNPDQPITFTATSSDVDGSVASIAWDFNNDGQFQESTSPTAQWSFGPGPNDVHFRAIDNEGRTTVVTKTLQIGPRQDADGDGYLVPADCAPDNAGINPGAAEIHDNGVDENCNGNGDDEDLDRDRDGFTRPGDCRDDIAAIHPGAQDVPDNKVDENCDGADAVLRLVPATVSYNYKLAGSSTKFGLIQVKLIPSGSTVTASCTPKKKCGKKARKKFTKRNANGTVKLKTFATKFKAGAVIEVRVTHAGMRGVVKRVKTRKAKAPVLSTLCLNPGATKPTSCT